MKRLRWLIPLFLIGAAVAGWFGFKSWIASGTSPTAPGQPFYVRYETQTSLEKVLRELSGRGVVKNVDAFMWYSKLQGGGKPVARGTYQLRPGMSVKEIFAALREPVRQMVRIPETNWARRTANLLEDKYNVARANDYMELVQRPGEFKNDVSFPLPTDSLEGYLFPDTYDLPPLLGARNVIERQLRAFEQKVWNGLNQPKNLHRLITVASMVEMEAGTDVDRYRIAGVIENRIKRGMRLQIDATILYGMQKWRRLTYDDYRNQRHAYNTYLIDGLPPGPICSPSFASIKAAMEPAQHNYLYYVALPDGTSIFSSDYAGHLANIRRRRAALKAAGQ